VHGKRSLEIPNVGAGFGDRWRNFLWQNLIGDRAPIIDVLSTIFAEDSSLGLVFPEDPHLVGWEKNLEIGRSLAAKMGLRRPLPLYLDFPVGTMFWARSKALEPLLALEWSWADYPEEPLAVDGTILHAFERLIPVVAEDAGFHIATTYFPGIVR
jgi:lipopolysaccharide biosynthesis protein